MLQVNLTDAAKKDLQKILRGDKVMHARLMEAIGKLEQDAYPAGVESLKGNKDGYRVKVGSYRILYRVQQDELIVEVFKLGARGGVYKQ